MSCSVGSKSIIVLEKVLEVVFFFVFPPPGLWRVSRNACGFLDRGDWRKESADDRIVGLMRVIHLR